MTPISNQWLNEVVTGKVVKRSEVVEYANVSYLKVIFIENLIDVVQMKYLHI